MGPKALEGSVEAKRLACAILETLGGLRGPVQAAEAMGISLTRYYQLETRMLQAMICSLEPRSRGRPRGSGERLADLEREGATLRRDLLRTQALLRAAQRSLGFMTATSDGKDKKSSGKESKAKKTVRRRRKVSRGERVRAALSSKLPAPESSAASESGAETSATPAAVRGGGGGA